MTQLILLLYIFFAKSKFRNSTLALFTVVQNYTAHRFFITLKSIATIENYIYIHRYRIENNCDKFQHSGDKFFHCVKKIIDGKLKWVIIKHGRFKTNVGFKTDLHITAILYVPFWYYPSLYEKFIRLHWNKNSISREIPNVKIHRKLACLQKSSLFAQILWK